MTTKYTLSGIAFGLAFPLVAWILDIVLSDLTLSPAVIVQIHQNNTIHYVVDLAPFVLGTVFYFLGKAYQRALNRNYFSSLLAEDRVTGSTSRFKLIISIVVVVILLFLGTASWYIQHEMKLKTQVEMGNLLDSILITTEQAAYFRLQEEQANVLTWARTEHIVQATRALLLKQFSRRKLIASPVKTTTLRSWFEPIRTIRGYQGFFIISPEGVNLASSRDSNIGQVNILTQQHPEFLQKIWQGDTALSAPHHAHVALVNLEGKLEKGLITMFVGAPIKDESGQIIAALTFRLDPHVDLSPIMRQGRIGESGETYAFITEGEIITQSRFDQQINKYGIAFIGVDGTIHLEVRDPGVNLTLGEQTSTPREQQPFTRMAISAMAGEAGQDLEGYRDYRGVPVIGSWLWSDRLGFGMTTEIDVAEGYAVLNFNRRIITISTFILGMLILGFVVVLIRYLDESRKSSLVLIENEQTTRLLLNSTGEAIYGIDLNGVCTFANQTCLEILGNQSEQELLGKNMHELIHHTHNDGTPYPVEECKIYQAFQQEEESHVDDEVLWRKDGSSFPAEYRSSPMKQHGKVIGAVVSFTDITERKVLEEEIRISEARLRSFFEVSQEGIIFHDKGTILDMNPKSEDITGYDRDEMIGHSVLEFGAPESKETIIEKMTSGASEHYQVLGLRKDGSKTQLDLTSSTHKYGDKNIRVVSIRDITAQMESEIRHRTIFNTMLDGLITIDEGGTIDSINPAAEKIFGYSSEEIIGKNIMQLMPESYRSQHKNGLERYNKTAEAHILGLTGVEIEGLRKDGSTFPLALSLNEMFIGEKRIFSGVISDITERKKLEHDRNQAEETLMAVIKGTASVTGADFFNSMVRHLASAFGVQFTFVTECIKKGGSRVRSLAFWHIDHFADTIEYDVEGTACKRVTMEGCPVYYASGVQKLFPEDRDLVDLGVDSYLGLPIFNSSKAVIGHVVLLNPTAIDDASRAESVLQIFAARAGAELERLQAEHEREEIATELTQLIETVNAPIYGVDIKGKLIEWNKQAEEVTGYSKQEVLGKEVIPIIFPREHRKRARLMIAKALKGQNTTNEEIPFCHKDGTTRQILFNINTSYDVKGNIIGAVGVGQDITELRQKETALQQAQKMEAVGQLTGGIAHDFNNLLSIISGNLRFLQQDIGETSVEINELFEDAMSAVDDGTELTQRLLGFSRNRALQAEDKNINDTIEKFVRFLARTLGESIELDIDLPDEDLFISVDSSQLENALLNLSLNARDAMPKGGTITISATRYHHGDGDGDEYSLVLSEDDYIKVSVTDTGTGINSEDLPHVYEPFFTTKEVGKGSGLGLSMVYGFTQQSGGACHIVSTPGKGTTVSMYFPEVMGDKTRDVDTKEEKEEYLQGAEVILVVEDEPRVRRVTMRDLKKLGYKTLEAENAAVARTMIESGEPVDLLFSDVLMPGEMDGHMLGRWVEENYPSIKVVLTSGYSKGKTDMSKDKAHQFPLVRKPYTVEKLAKQLRTTLTG